MFFSFALCFAKAFSCIPPTHECWSLMWTGAEMMMRKMMVMMEELVMLVVVVVVMVAGLPHALGNPG